MTVEEARQLAAQAWCKDSTSNITMVPELAEAFAEILVEHIATLTTRIAELESDREALLEVAKELRKRNVSLEVDRDLAFERMKEIEKKHHPSPPKESEKG